MQFKVPQFLEIEDKMFGPFTFREFIYLAGGGGFCFIIYKLLGLVWGAIPILAVAAFSLLLVYSRPNNKPLINMIEAGFRYSMQNKLYIWKKSAHKHTEGRKTISQDEVKIRMMSQNGLDGSKLRDLAWSLDVLDLSKQKSADSL